MHLFEKRTRLNVSAEKLFAWHERPSAFEELTPPFIKVRILKPLKALRDGEVTSLQIQLPFMPITWVARMQEIIPGRQFVDVQVSGPFSYWRHRHLFEPESPDSCWMRDSIDYTIPMGFLGNLFSKKIDKDLRRMFDYRHAKLIELFGA